MVDTVRGSGAATPGRCRRCSVPDWPPTRRGSVPTLPQRCPCGYAASPRRVFSAPALGTGYRALLLDRGHSSRQERLLLYIVPQKDAERCRRDAWNERRAIDSTAKDGLL